MFKKNTKGYKILTAAGYESFDGIVEKGSQTGLRLEFEYNLWVECTHDHEIYVNNLAKVPAQDLKLGDIVQSSLGPVALLNIVELGKGKVYDIVNAGKDHRFYANGVLVSNCEPIIFDETLISPTKIAALEAVEPVFRTGQVRWFKKPEKGRTYAVGLDPSLGTGGDNAAIQVYELPTMIQVAEWCNNRTPIPKQISILAGINRYILDITGEPTNIWYSVENNTLGEAALITIEEIGEENIPGIFLSETKKPGSGRRFRRGFNTTNKTKLNACSKLKTWVENDIMNLNSKMLISEIKNFVAVGSSYAAKPGEKDDLVMSTILVVRMCLELKRFDPEFDTVLADGLDDDYVEPMPFIMI
jgi:hypothetical protein